MEKVVLSRESAPPIRGGDTIYCRRLARAACFILAALAGGGAAAAQPYPAKPIRLVLGVGTGGVGDITMRLFAQQMSRSMGQQIVVDNRPGAGGIIEQAKIERQ